MRLYSKPEFLSEKEMQRIHEASLCLLKTKGIIFESPQAVELLKNGGASVDGKKVFLPEKMVERCLNFVPQDFRVEAVNPEHSVVVGGDRMLVHPAGGEVFLRDANDMRNSDIRMEDFENLQKIYQVCGNMDMAGYQPLSPVDVPLRTRNLRCLAASMIYTDKPWLAPMDNNRGIDKRKELGMFELVFGKGFLENHYVTWSIVTPESPLMYSESSCESIIEFAKSNQPVALVSAPMSGITSPIHIMGTIVQANTETLAGLCLAQSVREGVPVLPSASLTYGNLKSASWECASPDTALMLAAAIQMYKEFYHLPVRAQTGVTSAKCVDYQAGFETMQSLLTTAFMGVDVTSQSVGTLENLMTVSFEKTLIDDEIVGRVRRIINGIEVSEETLSVGIIMETGHGGNFLMHDSTLDYMYDGWQADLSDWNSYENWKKQPYSDIEKRAGAKVKEIIENAVPLLDKGTVADLKKYIEKAENNV